MANKKYEYKIKNVSDINALTNAISKHNGVEACFVENDSLFYVLNDLADEYEIMVDANELCAKYGGELIIGEDVDYVEVGDDVEEIQEKSADNSIIEQNQAELVENQEEETKENNKKVDAEDSFDYQDKLVVKKQTVKKDALFRIGELILSAILLTVCFLLPEDPNQTITARMIVGIFAFAIGGYEIFYSAISDIIRKKFISENLIMSIACLLGAFLGYLIETTALALVFCIAKEIETYANAVAQNKLEEIFYTGSVSVSLESGETKKLADIAVNDVLCLKQYDVIPCDGVSESECTLDCYRSLGVPETSVKMGEKVYAGSVVLGESLKMTVTATNQKSQIIERKNTFTDKLKAFTAVNKKVKIVDIILFVLSLLLTFIPPIFSESEYMLALKVWGARGIVILSISSITYALYLASVCIKNALTTLRYEKIEVNNIETYKTLANANSFKFLASTLTENGVMKPDTYGVMNELLAVGAKNVETEFDCELSEDERAKLDFVQKNVSKKKEITVGKDVTLTGEGDIAIESGEISFVPLSYKVAKASVKKQKAIIAIKIVAFLLTVAALVFVPFKFMNPIYFGVINGAITALFAIFALKSIKKAD